mgnify:CR=1 FL=1
MLFRSTRNIAIITNAGGPGVLAVDHCERVGLTPVQLEDRTKNVLNRVLPAAASLKNPVDVLGDALGDRYDAALQACRDDASVDGLIVLLTPQVMTPCDEIAEAIIATKKAQPLLPITTAFIGGGSVSKARDLLRTNSIPSYETPEEAVQSMAALLVHEEDDQECAEGGTDDDRSSAAHGILAKKHGLLSGEKTADLLRLYGLELPLESIAKSVEEAVTIASRIGFPVIAKIASKDILHKTDIGGVRTNLTTKEEVMNAFKTILKNAEEHAPSAGIDGVMIQQFLPIGREFIIGGMRDPSAGPLVMVGLGGIYTELFKDTCFRFAPIHTRSAYEMLASLRSWKLLSGMRGQAPLAIDKLAELLVTVSIILHDCPTIRELDLNPVLVGSTDLVLADVKVVCS